MSPEADLRIMEPLEFSVNASWQWSITFFSASLSLLSASLINVFPNVITVAFPSSERVSFVACKLFGTFAFYITKYSKIRIINFDLFSPFDKNSLKSQVVLDITDHNWQSLSCILIDTGLYVSATISTRL